MHLKILLGFFPVVIYIADSRLDLPVCDKNEEYSICIENSCTPTCQRPDASHLCEDFGCIRGCRCKDGFIRSTLDGSCIKPTKCSEYCLENQKYRSCSADRPIYVCNTASRECEQLCYPGCYCAEGYTLNSDGNECASNKTELNK